MSNAWQKHRIGKLHGNSVFIELPPGLSGGEEEQAINRASLYLGQSFKNADFLEQMREMLDTSHD